MVEKIMRKYALSERGARDLVKATAACSVQNFVLMLPVCLLYLLVSDMLAENVPDRHYWLFGAGIVAIAALICLAAYCEYNATYFASYKESGVRRIRLAEQIRKLPMSYFGKKDLSDLTSTMMADCTTLEQSFSHFMPQFFGAIISTCIVAVCVFAFEWRLALAALWPLPISLCMVAFSKRFQNAFQRRQMKAKMDCADGIQECLETARDLRSCNAQGKYLEGLDKKIKAVERGAVKCELAVALFVVTAQMLLKFGIATVTLAGAVFLADGSLELLTFIAFLMLVSRFYDPMSGALQNLAAILSTQINIDRMREIEQYPVQNGSEDFRPTGYDIVFDDVTFSYGDGEKVLDGVTFTAKQGKVTALIGPSGGGKSTVAKLAARFWDADGGSVSIGGVNVRDVDPETLLSAYSIVFQDVTLFDNTVMENIRIGKLGATDEEVLAAAKKANCDEFVSKLPDGYATVIGENGSTLSGGERQRISIARALLKDSPVILLDEATASLDADNETSIQQAISRMIERKTVLIIAHRMRTVAGADKLVVIKDGKVAEQGTPKQLEQSGGFYARTSALQSK